MIKRGNILARTLHKWFGLIIGLQILIWLASGLYMVIVNIDFIHGDPMVRKMQQTVAVPEPGVLSIAALQSMYPDASHIGLRPVMAKTFYSVTTADNRYLLNTINGEVVSPLNQDFVRDIAIFHFNGDAVISNLTLITTDAPMEIQRRRLPLWRVDFDDRYNTSFYIDPYTGGLVTRRHQYWRIFDFLWMLHIMDYENRTDAHNLLLKISGSTGIAFAISGLWLLFYSFSGRRRKKEAAK